MKCDELKPVFVDMSGNIVANELGELYYKPEVDAAIAELKKKLEDVQASMYADVVDANMENRKLRRALWIARALRAKECKYKYETWERHEERKVYKDYDMIAIVSRKARMWRKIERICIKKAEEYK